jgi:GTP-binding protein YchF
MSLQIGIVGLPNVGKSTLFNALTKSHAAESANYPFCTIDPNVGIVEVPDTRLNKLAEVVQPEKILPAAIEFVDIAGLVKGASSGEGLGNQFLSHIRQVDAIAHVVRVFEDDDIHHVHGQIDPESDKEVIETELIIADVQTVEKRFKKAESETKSGQADKKKYAALIGDLLSHLQDGKKAVEFSDDPEVLAELKDLHLLTLKPFIYVLNVKEDQINNTDINHFKKILNLNSNDDVVVVSAQIEAELTHLDEEEAQMFLDEIGLKEPTLNALIQKAYSVLGLETYFTAGVKEVRAWTVKKGSTAPQAAGVIHTDFEKGFIKADVVSFDDFVEFKGWAGCKDAGKQRLEGKEYIVQDGDVMLFKFNN